MEKRKNPSFLLAYSNDAVRFVCAGLMASYHSISLTSVFKLSSFWPRRVGCKVDWLCVLRRSIDVNVLNVNFSQVSFLHDLEFDGHVQEYFSVTCLFV